MIDHVDAVVSVVLVRLRHTARILGAGQRRVLCRPEENREAINYAPFDRRDELMVRMFNTPAAGLPGLAVQARTYLSEREFAQRHSLE
jgi:hypothetical protein